MQLYRTSVPSSYRVGAPADMLFPLNRWPNNRASASSVLVHVPAHDMHGALTRQGQVPSFLNQIARRALQMTNRSPRAPGAAATRGATPLRAMGYKYRVAARRLFHRSPTVLSRTQATAHKSHELPGPVWRRQPASLLPSYSSRCCSRAPP